MMDTILPILLYVFALPVGITLLSFVLSQKQKGSLALSSGVIALNLGFYTAYLGHFGFIYDSLLWSLVGISVLTLIGLWQNQFKIQLSFLIFPIVIIFLMLLPYQALWKKGIFAMIKDQWIIDASIFFAILSFSFQSLLKEFVSEKEQTIEQELVIEKDHSKQLDIQIALTLASLAVAFLTSSIAIVIGGSISLGQLSGALGLVVASVGLLVLFKGQSFQLGHQQALFGIAALAYLCLFSILMNAHFYLSPELPKLFVVLILGLPFLSLKTYLWAKNRFSSLQNPYLAVISLVGIAVIMSALILGFEWYLEQIRLAEQGSAYPY
jgi:hypothetical protein